MKKSMMIVPIALATGATLYLLLNKKEKRKIDKVVKELNNSIGEMMA